jgi:predicted nucleic acid-binding Zn ribbon protein
VTISFSAEFPLDAGFLRRECPHCERQFKWHHGPTETRPEDATDPVVFHCPYCGETAPPDQWWTREQLEYASGLVGEKAGKAIEEELRSAIRGLDSDFLQIKFGGFEPSPAPPALTESDDMQQVESPCHPWEPIKVLHELVAELHCIVCGERFSLG